MPTFLSSDEIKPEGRKDSEAVKEKTEMRTKEDKYVMKRGGERDDTSNCAD